MEPPAPGTMVFGTVAPVVLPTISFSTFGTLRAGDAQDDIAREIDRPRPRLRLVDENVRSGCHDRLA